MTARSAEVLIVVEAEDELLAALGSMTPVEPGIDTVAVSVMDVLAGVFAATSTVTVTVAVAPLAMGPTVPVSTPPETLVPVRLGEADTKVVLAGSVSVRV